MNEYGQIISWLQDKLPLIVIGLFGGIAGEVIRSEDQKKHFKLKYTIVYAVSSLLVIGFIDEYNWPIGIQIGCSIMGGFLSKEVLVFAVKRFKKKIGVDSHGTNNENRD